MMNVERNQKYCISLPGKEDRIIENVNYDKIMERVKKLGGSLVRIDSEIEKR